MSKHDTWVQLVHDSPFQEIEYLFPEGFPMRDPFGLECTFDSKGEIVVLWIVDRCLLSEEQDSALIKLIALRRNLEPHSISANEPICINNIWVESMFGEVENYRRSIELADFLELHPDDPAAFVALRQQQYDDWIIGSRIPDPMPERYEDIDTRFKTLELESAYSSRKINEVLRFGNYSALDLLTGSVMTDVLNELDPDAYWEVQTD